MTAVSHGIFVDPETTFQSTSKILGANLQLMSCFGWQPGLGVSVLFTDHFSQVLGISYG